MIRIAKITALLILFLGLFSCATKKKKGEVSWTGKMFHNTTARYNGYYNADILLQESMLALEEQHEDNYTKILNLYPYAAAENPKAVAPQLDRAIEKVTTVAALHEPSKWVDDCYLLMGKAQYLKQDFESAEETFEYFMEEFDPGNATSRLFQSSKSESKTDRKTETKLKNEARKKEREETKKAKEKDQEDAKNKKEEERKAKEKKREEDRKKKEEERKAKKKERSSKNKRSTKRRKVKDQPKEEIETKVEEKSENSSAGEKLEAETKTVEPSVQKTVKKEAIPDPPAPKIIPGTDDAWAAGSTRDENIIKKPAAGGGGLFKHQIAYYEGNLWMAKTYIERGRYFSAEYLLKKLRTFDDLPDEAKRELPVAEAYLALKQKKYVDAIPALEDAIEAANDKSLKARYAYIQAQIYQMHNQGDRAFASFERSKKFKPGFEMEFNADLSMAKNSWVSGKNSSESVLKDLEKMLGQDKYYDHLDQIYFTRGEIKFKSGDREGAIDEFKNSLAFNQNNKNQKIESYYTLAELYYEDENYTQAKNYYDSTLVLIPKLDERYKMVDKFSKNLTDIVLNLEIIAFQDSLLLIAELSQEDKIALAQKILENKKLESEIIAAENIVSRPVKPSTRRAGQLSSFFAYNPITLEQGKKDFASKWGTRTLTDDWRRSNELSSVFDEEFIQKEEEEDLGISDEDLQAVLREVPRGDEQKAAAHGKIQEAMIALGGLYRNKIQNFRKSVDILEEFLLKYPGTEKEIDALFGLYLSNLEIPDQTNAVFYKNLLIQKYPETKFASILQNPDFMEELKKEENQLEKYYQQTYQVFLEGDYQSAYDRIQSADDQFEKGHPLSAKFDLLEAMCLGNIDGQEKYVANLRQIITKYPNSEEGTRAREIIRFLQGDDSAFDPILYEEALEQFSLQDDRLHYIIFVVNGLKENQVQTMKNDIVRYNKDYHKLDKLRAPSEIYIDRDTKSMIVLLRKFNNKAKAMDYYDGVQKNKTVFIDESIPYELFAITQQNYREVLKQKSVNSYRVFFQANYLEN